ncbi:hypothetical protein [Sphingosinicella sp. BN140058]|nr:hypothetical protein [Sphingosinicella sp. BN140058]
MNNHNQRPERPKLGLLFGGTAPPPSERPAPILSTDDLRRIVSETIG